MDRIAMLPTGDRRDLFSTVAAERGNMQPLIVEKDFWVVWSLRQLFTTEWKVGLTFKGGTSLSKAHGLIRRFSEDVDISLERDALGFTEDREPANASSGNRARKLLEELSTTCRSHVGNTMLPKLSSRFEERLGPSDGEDRWSLQLDPDDPQTILFFYPSALSPGADIYVHQSVRLEIGARAEHWPSETKEITSYAAETMPDLFSSPSCEVRVLSALRTFWEKATILHALHHKPLDRPLGDRQSRHYSDLAVMADSPVGSAALGRLDLLDAVAEHKAVFFRSGWANYDSARAGTLRLLPPDERLGELLRDYRTMREMFFDEPAGFDEMMARLKALEVEINSI